MIWKIGDLAMYNGHAVLILDLFVKEDWPCAKVRWLAGSGIFTVYQSELTGKEEKHAHSPSPPRP
jgi:hypothetical protein